MNRYDWLLFLHVLGAFMIMASITFFWLVILSTWNADRPVLWPVLGRLTRPAGLVVMAGGALTIVFGIWLTLDIDGYELQDGWILGGLVMWLVATVAGQRSGAEYMKAKEIPLSAEPSPEFLAIMRSRRGLVLHAISTLATLVALALMIFKPGAP